MSMPRKNQGDRRVPKTQRLIAPTENEPFQEWTREQKDAFAQKKMDEMKLRNEQFKKRYDEVEKDRLKAEKKMASVTSVLNVPKENVNEETQKIIEDISKPPVKQREWDKGKSLVNLEHWNNRKPDNNVDNQTFWSAYGRDKKSRPNASSHRNESDFRKPPRGRGQRRGNFNNFSQNSGRRPYAGNKDFAQGRTISDMDQSKQSNKYENDAMWREEGVNEVRHRQIRVEKWVKSINNDCLKEDSSKSHRVKYQNKPWDREENVYVNASKISNSDRNLKSMQKTSQKYPTSKSKGDHFSGTYENNDFKKHERKPNNWRKPNIPGQAEFLANLTRVEDSPPVFEISEDMIVKIEGHTVITDFRYNADVARSYEQENWVEAFEPYPANEDIQPGYDSYNHYEEIERYGVQENWVEAFEPLPVNEDIQPNYNSYNHYEEEIERYSVQETSDDELFTGNEHIPQETDSFHCCENAVETYSKPQNYAENDALPLNDVTRQDSDTKDLWEKTGRWEDCNYDSDVEAQDFVASSCNELYYGEPKNHNDEVKYQVNQKMQPSDDYKTKNVSEEIKPNLDYLHCRAKSFSSEMLQIIPAERVDFRETLSD